MSNMESSMGGMGRPKFTQSEGVGQEACYNWPRGECRFGGSCNRDHPSNLSPHQTKELPDFVVDNEPGKACRRCLGLGVEAIQCDKLGRPGSDDPCSECRWFAGGPATKCTLSLNTSLNDTCWNLMISRGNHGYTLPEPRPKDQAKQVPAKALQDLARQGRPLPPVPSPMNGVRADWKGETKEELLAKPHPLPPQVRAHPRAYLVLPRVSSTLQKIRTWNATSTQGDGKRKLDDQATPALLPAAPSPLQQYLPPITSMPTDAFGRQAIRCMWNNIDKTWTNWYADGSMTVSASYNAGPSSQLPFAASATQAMRPFGAPPSAPNQRHTQPLQAPLPRNLSRPYNHALPPRPDLQSTSRTAVNAVAQPLTRTSVDEYSRSSSKRPRINESTPQLATSQASRQETVAVPDQMDVEPTKAPATNATMMPAIGMITENDEGDEDEMKFDDLTELDIYEEQ
ncbi:hypothetical protein C7974DRAFT_452516 [Boeremia exigua]|uniref:uncharacterized protein n=1 Tax=Boeremia exigua TaxID=749465 RepID=UPI001E8EEC7B|nr:uncharacterized protein C7974DRAFT_452516 [Boeremia exigua]KAH6633268.1 hypothetical protein C7974DRAFT_452516 [Boeremia exigua]